MPNSKSPLLSLQEKLRTFRKIDDVIVYCSCDGLYRCGISCGLNLLTFLVSFDVGAN